MLRCSAGAKVDLGWEERRRKDGDVGDSHAIA